MLSLVEDLNEATKNLETVESKLDSIQHRSSISSNADKVGQQFTLIFCSLTDSQLEALIFARQLSFAMSDDFTKFLQTNFKTKVSASVDEVPISITKQDKEIEVTNQPIRTNNKFYRSKLISHLCRKWDFENEVVHLDQIVEYLYETKFYGEDDPKVIKRKAYHTLYTSASKIGFVFKKHKFSMKKDSE